MKARPANPACSRPPIFAAARRQPSPWYRLGSPSRSSNASAAPVDAPEGTDAEALIPPSRTQVARTVGLPRLSSTSRPESRSILGIVFDLMYELRNQVGNVRGRLCHKSENNIVLARSFPRRQVLER